MSAPASPTQDLVFAVAGPVDGEVSEVRVEWVRADEPRTLRLVDDGTEPADSPWDGVWTATDTGPYVRDANVRVVVVDLDGAEHLVFSGLVHPEDARESVLAWQVTRGDEGLAAVRLASGWPGATAVIPEAVHVYVGLAWTCAIVVLVAGLVHAARREGIGW